MPRQKEESSRPTYPTDLTDRQWNILKPLLPSARGKGTSGGRPRDVDLREVLNAVFYLLRTGCAWRMLPHDFPAWPIVRYYFDAWKKDGTWKKIHDVLRAKVRIRAGKNPEPTAGIIDSQSSKTTEKGGSWL